MTNQFQKEMKPVLSERKQVDKKIDNQKCNKVGTINNKLLKYCYTLCEQSQ